MIATNRQAVLAIQKRGRSCVVGKLVRARPCGRFVLAVVFRNRQPVENFVSVPPIVLNYAREAGAELFIVRLDRKGRCLSLPLADVERRGILKPSDGAPEWFVRLTDMTPTAWQEWAYVENTLELDDSSDYGPYGGVAA